MNLVTGNHPVCKEICDALGIRHCSKLEIRLDSKSLVKITAEFYPEENGVTKLPAILKRFRLVEETTDD